MHYQIYWDLLFFNAIAWSFCSLCLTNQKNWHASGLGRILVAAILFGGGFTVICFLPLSAAWKVILGVALPWGTTRYAFPAGRGFEFRRILETYLTCTILWGSGVALAYRGITVLWPEGAGMMTLLLLEGLLFLVGSKWIARQKRQHGRMGKAKLVNRENVLWVKAFVDTGNTLLEPISGKPACVLDGAMDSILFTERDLFRVIPYHGVGVEKGVLKGYLLPELELELEGTRIRRRNVYVAVGLRSVMQGKEACLLVHPQVLEDHVREGRKRKGEQTKNDDAAATAGEITVPLDQTGKKECRKTDGRSVLHRRGGHPAAAIGAGEGSANDK